MGRKGMMGKIGLSLIIAGTALLAAGCSADHPEVTSMGNAAADTCETAPMGDATAEHRETEPSEDKPFLGEEAFGQLQVAGPEGSSFLSYRADCPDAIHYRVEICDEIGDIRQELIYDISEDFVETRNGGDEVWLYEDSIVRTEDVNGDGSEDLWLYLGTVGAGAYSYWACFTYDSVKAQFDRVKGFEQLKEPYVGKDGVVESVYCAGVSDVFWEKYSIRENRLIPLGKLECMYGEGPLCLYNEEVYEDGVLVKSQSGVPGTEVVNTELWESQLTENARQ